MFSIFKRKETLREAEIFKGATDMHSHILPGVDDGVKKMSDSLEILGKYEALGLKKLWLTPHIKEDIPNSHETLDKTFDELKNNYSGAIKLQLAAEHMMDGEFDEVLKRENMLTISDGEQEMLLVETSFFSNSINLRSTLSSVMSAGYFPLLAHPERYSYMTLGDYGELSKMGVRFQLNLPSVVGLYGSDVMRRSHDLIKLGLYDYFGSDLHTGRSINKIFDTPIPRSITQKIEQIKAAKY